MTHVRYIVWHLPPSKNNIIVEIHTYPFKAQILWWFADIFRDYHSNLDFSHLKESDFFMSYL